MRQAWLFTKWFLERLKFTEITMIIAMSCLLIGGFLPSGTNQTILYYIAGSIYALWVGKWLLWDGGKSLWKQFIKDQNKVVDLVKKDY
jgi:hypothetical protein